MNIEILKLFFMWCTILNAGLLILSFLIWMVAADFIYKVHGKWFSMPRESFNLVFYAFIGFYKLFVCVFCFVPWVALVLIS